MIHNSVKKLIYLWVGLSFLLYSHDMTQVQNLWTCPLMSCWSYFLVHASPPGLWALFYFILFYFISFVSSSGKWTAGPVCGITAQDPSGAGSQKRKQLSDNELLFCNQTISEGWVRKLGECRESHTDPHVPMHIGWTCLWVHAYTDGIIKSHVEPLLASGLRPAIFYTSDCQIIQSTLSQNKEKQAEYPIIDKHSRSSHNKIQRGVGEKNLRPSKNAILFLAGPLRGLCGALWQQRGSAVQTAHILELTPVNRAGGFTRARRSLPSSVPPQSHRTATVGTQEAHFEAPWPKDSQTSPPSIWLPSFSLLPGTWRDCGRSCFCCFWHFFKWCCWLECTYFLTVIVEGSLVCTCLFKRASLEAPSPSFSRIACFL